MAAATPPAGKYSEFNKKLRKNQIFFSFFRSPIIKKQMHLKAYSAIMSAVVMYGHD